MTCCELLEFIDDYLDGGLRPDVRAVFETHMGKCRPCKAYLDTYLQTVKASRGCRDEAVADAKACDALPAELVQAILAACGCKKAHRAP